MASSNVEDFFKLMEFGIKLCLLVAGLIALPFVIAAHEERCRKQASAMSAKARELGFEFSALADSRVAGLVRYLDSLGANNGGKRYALNVVEGSFDGHPVAVFGDVNSTMASALVAAKMDDSQLSLLHHGGS